MVEAHHQVAIRRLRDYMVPVRPERFQGLGDAIVDGSPGIPAHNVGVGDVDG